MEVQGQKHTIMSSTQYDWAKNIPCRNIQIHGFCKFEHKGCSYNHDIPLPQQSTTTTTGTTTAKTNAISNTSNTSSNLLSSGKSPSSSSSASTALASSFAKAPIFKPSSLLTQKSNSTNKIDTLSNSPTANNANSNKFNLSSPAFTPIPLNKNFSPSLDNIPTFVPSNDNPISSTSPNNKNNETLSLATNENSNNDKIESSNNLASVHSINNINNDNSPNSPFTDLASSLRSSLNKTNSFNPVNTPSFTPNLSSIYPNNTINSTQPNEEDIFYQNTNLFPINFLLYAPSPPPHIELNKKPNEKTVDDLFINNKLREYLQLKNEESLKSILNNELDLPSHVSQYHSLYPIDHNYDYSNKSFGYKSFVYKCMSNNDGKLYTMRRLQNVPITSTSILKSVKQWKKLNCANCIKIYEVFTTRAFNDNSLILIYDYYPMSLTLIENHFMSLPGKNPDLITEDSLWNYTVQLLNAITEINKLNLSVGVLDPSKIIITNHGRIRLSALGIYDILRDVELKKTRDNAKSSNDFIPDQDVTINNIEENNNEKENKNKNENENSDLLNLGKLILFLAKSTNFLKTQTDDPNEIICQLNFTSVFKNMLSYLFSPDATIEQLQQLIAPMILKLTNGLQNNCDQMESTLMKELENGRLVRLFAKLDFISERPEKDGKWSETGERYPIKLFKDYIFHQVDDNGKPVVDLTHVINCLNKLDAGVDENLLLVSPDEMTCLIMSYKDLKELVNKSFLSLLGKE